MEDFFKPGDFDDLSHYQNTCSTYHAATIGNKKLNVLIESWPVVYSECFIPETGLEHEWKYAKDKNNTHKARLAFIEETIKEPCKHEPTAWDVHWKSVFCKHCGVELQATWSEKK